MLKSNRVAGSARAKDGGSTNVIAEDAEGLHHADHVPKHSILLAFQGLLFYVVIIILCRLNPTRFDFYQLPRCVGKINSRRQFSPVCILSEPSK